MRDFMKVHLVLKQVTGKLWLHCFENSELEQTDNTLLDTEVLTQFSQQFKDILLLRQLIVVVFGYCNC